MLARFDGSIEHLLKVLTEDHYGWSHIDPEQDSELPEYGYRDGRFVAVPGVGVAYTTAQGQSAPEEWITGTLNRHFDQECGSWGTEWGYLFTGTDAETAALVVVAVDWRRDDIPKVAARIPVRALPRLAEAAWRAIEFRGARRTHRPS